MLTSLLLTLLLTQPDGNEIMQKVKSMHKLQDEDRRIEMQLIDRRGKTKSRSVHMLNMETSDGLSKLMLIFLEPRDVEGTGLLTWEHADRDDDQWLYLPSLKKEKRIASGSKRSPFMGTDFAYEDLQVENLAKHDYAVVGEETIDGNACWKIEAVLKNKKDTRSSGYAKRVLYVRKDIHYTVRIDYHDRRGAHIKTLTNGAVKNIQGNIYRSNDFVMENIKKKSKTRMVVNERKVNQGLNENDFTVRKLKSF